MNVVNSYYTSQYDTQYQPQYDTQYQPVSQFGYQQYSNYNSTPIPQYQTQPTAQQYYQQPNYYPPNSYFFDKNETLFPDYATYPDQTDFQSPYTLYNINTTANVAPYISDGYVYEPYMKQVPPTFSPDREQNTEEILKKNPHLWSLYQSGRFEIVQMFDSREKKIILKEKSTKADPKYQITKFKVPVNTSQGTDDGHILLVSFSNSQLEQNQQTQVDSNHFAFDEVLNRPTEHVIKPVEPFSNTHYTSDEQRIVGPGSGLVAKLVEGSSSESESDFCDDEDDEVSTSKTESKSKNQSK